MDVATKLEASRTIASDARDATLIEVDGVNHNGFLEKAPVYNEAIRSFGLSLSEPDVTPLHVVASRASA